MCPTTTPFPLIKLASFLCAFVIGLFVTEAAHAQTSETSNTATIAQLEEGFQEFLTEYRREIKQRNKDFLVGVHPSLPNEMYDLFFNISIDMMKFSDENGVAPKIECKEYNACKVIYSQPNDNWAAQQFIFHNGAWRWLEQ